MGVGKRGGSEGPLLAVGPTCGKLVLRSEHCGVELFVGENACGVGRTAKQWQLVWRKVSAQSLKRQDKSSVSSYKENIEDYALIR